MQNKVRIVKDGQTIDLDNLISGSASKPINAIKVNYGNGQSAFVYNTLEVPLQVERTLLSYQSTSGPDSGDREGRRRTDNQFSLTNDAEWYWFLDKMYVNVSDLPDTAAKRAQTYIKIDPGIFVVEITYDRHYLGHHQCYLPLFLHYNGGKVQVPADIPSGVTRLYLVPDFTVGYSWQTQFPATDGTSATYSCSQFHYKLGTSSSSVGVKFMASSSIPNLYIPYTWVQQYLTESVSGVSDYAHIYGPGDPSGDSYDGDTNSPFYNSSDNTYKIRHWSFNVKTTTRNDDSHYHNAYSNVAWNSKRQEFEVLSEVCDLYIGNDKVKTYNRFKNDILVSTGLPSGESWASPYPAPVSSSDYSYSVYRESSKVESDVGLSAVPSKNSIIYPGDVIKAAIQVFDADNFTVSATGSPSLTYSVNTSAQKIGTVTVSQNQAISLGVTRITTSGTADDISLGTPTYDSENDRYYIDKTFNFPVSSNAYITKVTVDSVNPSGISIYSSIDMTNRTIKFANSNVDSSYSGTTIRITYTFKYYTNPAGNYGTLNLLISPNEANKISEIHYKIGNEEWGSVTSSKIIAVPVNTTVQTYAVGTTETNTRYVPADGYTEDLPNTFIITSSGATYQPSSQTQYRVQGTRSGSTGAVGWFPATITSWADAGQLSETLRLDFLGLPSSTPTAPTIMIKTSSMGHYTSYSASVGTTSSETYYCDITFNNISGPIDFSFSRL